MAPPKKAILMTNFFRPYTDFPLYGYESIVLDYLTSEIDNDSKVYVLLNVGQINIGPILLRGKTTLNEIDDALVEQIKIYPPYIEGKTFSESSHSYTLQQLKAKQMCFEAGIDEVVILDGPINKHAPYPSENLEKMFLDPDQMPLDIDSQRNLQLIGIDADKLAKLSGYKPNVSVLSYSEIKD